MSKVDKKLLEKIFPKFNSAKEWSDLVTTLNLLKEIIHANQNENFSLISEKIQLSKRLSQCLNPVYPSGLHEIALKVYEALFENIIENNKTSLKENSSCIIEDISLYFPNLFNFIHNASLNIKTYFVKNIIEKHVLILNLNEINYILKGLMCCLLSLLEEKDEQFYKNIKSILLRIKIIIDNNSKFFYNLWNIVLNYKKLRLNTLKYLNEFIPNYKLIVTYIKLKNSCLGDNKKDNINTIDNSNIYKKFITVKEQIEKYNISINENKEIESIIVSNFYPDLNTLVLNSLCECLEDNNQNYLIKRVSLDFIINKFPFECTYVDKIFLVNILSSSLILLDKIEYSTVRRLASWLLNKQIDDDNILLHDNKNNSLIKMLDILQIALKQKINLNLERLNISICNYLLNSNIIYPKLDMSEFIINIKLSIKISNQLIKEQMFFSNYITPFLSKYLIINCTCAVIYEKLINNNNDTSLYTSLKQIIKTLCDNDTTFLENILDNLTNIINATEFVFIYNKDLDNLPKNITYYTLENGNKSEKYDVLFTFEIIEFFLSFCSFDELALSYNKFFNIIIALKELAYLAINKCLNIIKENNSSFPIMIKYYILCVYKIAILTNVIINKLKQNEILYYYYLFSKELNTSRKNSLNHANSSSNDLVSISRQTSSKIKILNYKSSVNNTNNNNEELIDFKRKLEYLIRLHHIRRTLLKEENLEIKNNTKAEKINSCYIFYQDILLGITNSLFNNEKFKSEYNNDLSLIFFNYFNSSDIIYKEVLNNSKFDSIYNYLYNNLGISENINISKIQLFTYIQENIVYLNQFNTDIITSIPEWLDNILMLISHNNFIKTNNNIENQINNVFTLSVCNNIIILFNIYYSSYLLYEEVRNNNINLSKNVYEDFTSVNNNEYLNYLINYEFIRNNLKNYQYNNKYLPDILLDIIWNKLSIFINDDLINEKDKADITKINDYCCKLIISFYDIDSNIVTKYICNKLIYNKDNEYSKHNENLLNNTKKFIYLWNYVFYSNDLKNSDVMSYVFENGECIFKILDLLETNNQILVSLTEEWLLSVNTVKNISCILKPLFNILLDKNITYYSLGKNILNKDIYYIVKEHDSRRVLEALKKLNIIIKFYFKNDYRINFINNYKFFDKIKHISYSKLDKSNFLILLLNTKSGYKYNSIFNLIKSNTNTKYLDFLICGDNRNKLIFNEKESNNTINKFDLEDTSNINDNANVLNKTSKNTYSETCLDINILNNASNYYHINNKGVVEVQTSSFLNNDVFLNNEPSYFELLVILCIRYLRSFKYSQENINIFDLDFFDVKISISDLLIALLDYINTNSNSKNTTLNTLNAFILSEISIHNSEVLINILKRSISNSNTTTCNELLQNKLMKILKILVFDINKLLIDISLCKGKNTDLILLLDAVSFKLIASKNNKPKDVKDFISNYENHVINVLKSNNFHDCLILGISEANYKYHNSIDNIVNFISYFFKLFKLYISNDQNISIGIKLILTSLDLINNNLNYFNINITDLNIKNFLKNNIINNKLDKRCISYNKEIEKNNVFFLKNFIINENKTALERAFNKNKLCILVCLKNLIINYFNVSNPIKYNKLMYDIKNRYLENINSKNSFYLSDVDFNILKTKLDITDKSDLISNNTNSITLINHFEGIFNNTSINKDDYDIYDVQVNKSSNVSKEIMLCLEDILSNLISNWDINSEIYLKDPCISSFGVMPLNNKEIKFLIDYEFTKLINNDYDISNNIKVNINEDVDLSIKDSLLNKKILLNNNKSLNNDKIKSNESTNYVNKEKYKQDIVSMFENICNNKYGVPSIESDIFDIIERQNSSLYNNNESYFHQNHNKDLNHYQINNVKEKKSVKHIICKVIVNLIVYYPLEFTKIIINLWNESILIGLTNNTLNKLNNNLSNLNRYIDIDSIGSFKLKILDSLFYSGIKTDYLLCIINKIIPTIKAKDYKKSKVKNTNGLYPYILKESSVIDELKICQLVYCVVLYGNFNYNLNNEINDIKKSSNHLDNNSVIEVIKFIHNLIESKAPNTILYLFEIFKLCLLKSKSSDEILNLNINISSSKNSFKSFSNIYFTLFNKLNDFSLSDEGLYENSNKNSNTYINTAITFESILNDNNNNNNNYKNNEQSNLIDYRVLLPIVPSVYYNLSLTVLQNDEFTIINNKLRNKYIEDNNEVNSKYTIKTDNINNNNLITNYIQDNIFNNNFSNNRSFKYVVLNSIYKKLICSKESYIILNIQEYINISRIFGLITFKECIIDVLKIVFCNEKQEKTLQSVIILLNNLMLII